MSVRIRGWCDDERRTAHQWQAGFHFIAINDAMPLGGTWPGFKGIDDESLHEINTIGRIERPAHRPEFGEMPAVDARHCMVNDVPTFFRLRPARFINIGAGRQNQGGNVFRIGGGDLDANGRAGVVADNRRTTNAERRQELMRSFSPVFD